MRQGHTLKNFYVKMLNAMNYDDTARAGNPGGMGDTLYIPPVFDLHPPVIL